MQILYVWTQKYVGYLRSNFEQILNPSICLKSLTVTQSSETMILRTIDITYKFKQYVFDIMLSS